MNIAFTSILIFILLAPGFLFRSAYSYSKLSVNDPSKNIINDLAYSVLPSLIIHLLAIIIVEKFTSYYIDFVHLGNLITGLNEKSVVKDSFIQLRKFIYPIFYYNLAVLISSFLLGIISRILIRRWRWDRKKRFFRFSNKWHYIFTGECLDFPDVPDDFEEITDKVINVLCSVNGENILYTGQYFNYYIDGNGDLEAIHLKYPMRRYLKDDGKNDNYYTIESRYLVIPNKNIININFRYLNRTEVDEKSLTEEEKKSAIVWEEISGSIQDHNFNTTKKQPKKKEQKGNLDNTKPKN